MSEHDRFLCCGAVFTDEERANMRRMLFESPTGEIRTVASASMPEPAPVPNASTPVWDAVIEDMRARDSFGRAKYGTPLQAGNGRDALVDAYQEALDLVVYLKQAIMERG